MTAPQPAGTRVRRIASVLVVILATVVAALSSAPAASAAPAHRFYAIGDSVMMDAAPNLHHTFPAMTINAKVSRQVSDGINILRQKKSAHTMAGTTVFGLGTNGSLTRGQLTSIINLTAGHKLIMITSHCGYCSWTNSNNATIRALCTKAHHCYISYFQYHAVHHPGWFGSDGVHMPIGGTGAGAYAHYVWLAARNAHSWAG